MRFTFSLIFTLVFGFFCMASYKANAHKVMDAKTLLILCQSDEEKELASCASYIQGIVDYHILVRSLGTAPTVNFCLPEALTTDQEITIVRDYLTGNQQHQNFIAAPAVALAFYTLFPCS